MKKLSFLSAFLLIFLSAAGISEARTFCVENSVELQQAITTAAANGQDDEIRLLQGRYLGNFVYSSNELYDLVIKGGYVEYCSSRVADTSKTVLHGTESGKNVIKFLYLGIQEVNFVIDGVTIQNGLSSGVYIYSSGSVFITNNTIHHSSFKGVEIDSDLTLDVTLINNTISDNNSSGIYIDIDGRVNIINNTITKNSGQHGGGIDLTLQSDTARANIYNNIIWNNKAMNDGSDLSINNDGDGNSTPSQVNLFNNDFDQSADGTFIAIPFPIDTSNLDNADPLFANAPSNDYHLTDDSPCLDAGDNSAPLLPAADKDGNQRIVNGTVDMGAYEYEYSLMNRCMVKDGSYVLDRNNSSNDSFSVVLMNMDIKDIVTGFSSKMGLTQQKSILFHKTT